MLDGLKNMVMGSSTRSARGARSEGWGAFLDNAPSWGELQALVAAKEQHLGIKHDDPETGAPTAKALRRTFGSREPIRVKLYRDHAAWCPYCHKVWLQLEEKRIPYTIEKINMRCYGDKPRSFLQKVPAGMLPVLELDGRVITESAEIMAELERAFPQRPLLPARGTPERERADQLMRLERQLFSAWMGWLTSGWSHEQQRQKFETVMRTVEEQLGAAGGPYFMGADLSMVDLAFIPFVERAVASLAYYKGYAMRGEGRYPNLEAWFAALEQRESYLATRSDFYTHCHDLPPQLGGCAMHADGRAVAEAIDGRDGRTWHLPLPPLTASSLEPYAPGDNPSIDTVTAAARLVGNRAAICRFAARGVGAPGDRPVSAPLSDPTAVPNEAAVPHVDAALRHVAHALLVGVDGKQTSENGLQVERDADGMRADLAAPSLAYLRDRVGVPRDMDFPAARQLRAHLNWVIDHLTV